MIWCGDTIVVPHFTLLKLMLFSLPKNQVLAKVMLKFIALQLMSYFNSINSSETAITLICFIKCSKITRIFLCMNAMHMPVASIL
jgi:hypothetical protein